MIEKYYFEIMQDFVEKMILFHKDQSKHNDTTIFTFMEHQDQIRVLFAEIEKLEKTIEEMRKNQSQGP